MTQELNSDGKSEAKGMQDASVRVWTLLVTNEMPSAGEETSGEPCQRHDAGTKSSRYHAAMTGSSDSDQRNVTLRVSAIDVLMPPPLPRTVIVSVPNGVPAGTVIVMVEVPAPGAEIDAGLNATVTPDD